MAKWSEEPSGWRIRNYSEFHTQEAEDKDNRQGLALTGNCAIGGTPSHGRLRTPEVTPANSIELYFAKKGLDIRVEAIDCINRKIIFSAQSYDDYLLGKDYLENEGWIATFDPKRAKIPGALYFANLQVWVQVASVDFITKTIRISMQAEDDFSAAQKHLQAQGWEVTQVDRAQDVK